LRIEQLFEAAAWLHATKPAVVTPERRLSFGQLRSEAQALAAVFRGLGLQRGDRVAIVLPNTVDAAVTIWGVWAAGGVVIPVHAALRGEGLQAVLRDADPRWAVTAGELALSFAAMREALPGAGRLLVWSPRPDAVDVLPLAPGTQGDAAPGPAGGDATDVAALIYTSGSTGEPKGVMLSHANMAAAMLAVNAYLRLESSDIVYSPLPLSSSYGLYQLLSSLSLGATIVLDRSFAFPARSLALLAAERATVLAAVPTMYAWLATSPRLTEFDLSSLRILTSAASSLPVEHARRVRERLPQARLYVMYGQTECKRISFLDPDDLERKPGSVGRGMPFQEHAVVDEEGRPVAAGESGELVVRGPHVMVGYWRKPELTAWKLRSCATPGETWLHTDDLFRLDEDGFLYFVGRRDDILKVGGHKVSPREVEEVLCQMPGVREAAVIGMPDEAWGEAVRAFVVQGEGAALDAAAVQRFCSARLRGFMVPKAVDFLRDLPKTESGKVKKRELR
jgi:amino acid adenylation domain-containing protein